MRALLLVIATLVAGLALTRELAEHLGLLPSLVELHKLFVFGSDEVWTALWIGVGLAGSALVLLMLFGFGVLPVPERMRLRWWQDDADPALDLLELEDADPVR